MYRCWVESRDAVSDLVGVGTSSDAAAVCITWGFFHATLHWHQVIAGIVLMAVVAMVQRAQAAVEPV
jgi:MFS-type transporter involved in bile tolerance (Atg22 family)